MADFGLLCTERLACIIASAVAAAAAKCATAAANAATIRHGKHSSGPGYAAASAARAAIAAAANAAAACGNLPNRWRHQDPQAFSFDTAALVRSPSAPKYLVHSLAPGQGGLDRGAMLAGGVVVAAVQQSIAPTRTYEHLFGIKPELSSAARSHKPYSHHLLTARLPRFPFDATGPALGLKDPEAAATFSNLTVRLRGEKPWSVVMEASNEIITSNGGQDLRTVLQTFDECGYRVKHALVDARLFRLPCLHFSTYFLAVRKEIAVKAKWDLLDVPRVPLHAIPTSFPSFDDSLCQRDFDPYTDGAVRCDTKNVTWHQGPPGEGLLRDLVPAHDRKFVANVIVLGHTRDHIAVVSSRGALPQLSPVWSYYVYVHRSALHEGELVVRTPCRSELLRIWGWLGSTLPANPAAVLAEEAVSCIAKAQVSAIFKCLDRFVSTGELKGMVKGGERAWTPDVDMKSDGTVIPRSRLYSGALSVYDVYTQNYDRAVCKYINIIVSMTSKVKLNKFVKRPPALVLNASEYMQPGAELFVWDMRAVECGGHPVRVRYRPPQHNTTLQPLVDKGLLDGFQDQNIVQILSRFGIPTGANASSKSILHYPHTSYWSELEAAVQDLQTEVDSGCVQRIDATHPGKELRAKVDGGRGCQTPFVPCRCEPNAIIEKKQIIPGAKRKVRRLSNKKCGIKGAPDGTETNSAVDISDYAKQQLVTIDDTILIILYLLPIAVYLNLPILGLTGDLSRAYRRVSCPYTEWWMQTTMSVFFDKQGGPVFAWLVDKALQFGGRLGPLYFSRITAAIVHAWVILIERTMHDIDYVAKWCDQLARGTAPDLTPLQGHYLSRKNSDRYNCLLHYRSGTDQKNLDHLEGMASAENKKADAPTMPKAISQLNPRRLFGAAGYIDDFHGICIGLMLATLMRDSLWAIGELCKLIWGEDKWELGAPATVWEFLGTIFDMQDLAKPMVRQPEKKKKELVHILKDLVGRSHASLAELRSLAGRLLNASKVVRRGRLHVNGIFAAVRCPPQRQGIPLGRWFHRNVNWWLSYYASGGDGMCFIKQPPSYRGLAQSDASGDGFGAYWQTKSHLYYFRGTWSAEEALECDINILECVTAVWLLDMGKADFAEHGVVLECDNMQSVNCGTNFKIRREAMAQILERYDTVAEVHHIDAQIIHIPGVLNGPADALSRHDVLKFMELTSHLRLKYQEVKLPADMRDLSSLVRTISSARGTSKPRGVHTAQRCATGSDSVS